MCLQAATCINPVAWVNKALPWLILSLVVVALRPIAESRSHAQSLGPLANIGFSQASDDSEAKPVEEAVRLRVRLTWGGGRKTLWHGRIGLSEGELSAPVSLGLETDSPVAHYQSDGDLLIEPWLPRAYDGVDFTVEGPLDAELTWAFFDANTGVTQKQSGRVTLRELMAQPSGRKLDDYGNRLYVQRAPGDELRVSFQREHLVFAPFETFDFDIEPAFIERLAGGSWNLTVTLQPARSDGVMWTQRRPIVLNEQGSANVESFSISLPFDPSAYQIIVAIEGRRLAGPWVKPKAVARRVVDIVVAPRSLGDDGVSEGSKAEQVPWELRHEVDPTNPGWMDRIQQLDQLNLVSRFYNGRLGNREPHLESFGEMTMVRLEPGEWQAFPLSVAETLQPHLLEVVVPDAHPQQLVVSLLENQAGATMKQLDSGLTTRRRLGTPPFDPSHSGVSTGVHQLMFWPSTRAPWVVLSNPDPKQPAVFGVLRVFDGPETLEQAEPLVEVATPSPNDFGVEIIPRQVGPYLEKPTLPDSFWVDKWLEREGGQAIDDWATFDESIRRLIEYLKWAGYNSAMITVAADGSGWYPSQHLKPSPKYDSGLFSSEGRDPIRKDIVELLFRHFDSAGLKLIPVLEVSGPLPALEELRRSDSMLNLDQLDEAGTSLLAQRLNQTHPVGFYQPLQPDVSTHLHAVVEEVVTRYSEHASWCGIGLNVGPESHWYYASGGWGLDEPTLERFRAALAGTPRERDTVTPRSCVYGEHQDLWRQWRSQQLTQQFVTLENSLAAAGPQSRLYLLGIDWFQNQEMTRRYHPSVRGDAEYGRQAWTDAGFDPRELQRLENTVVLPGQGQDTLWPASRRRVERVMYESSKAATLLTPLQQSGVLVHRTPATVELPEFERLLSAGKTRGDALIQPDFSTAGYLSRKAFVQALTLSDQRVWFSGGWGVSQGQDAILAPLRMTLAALPDQPFTTLEEVHTDQCNVELVAREMRNSNRTWWYLVNPTPWEVQVSFDIVAESKVRPVALSRLPGSVSTSTSGTQAELSLEPFGVVAFFTDDPRARLLPLTTTVDPSVNEQLKRDLDEFADRVVDLEFVPEPLPVLMNPGFEEPATSRFVPGWSFGGGTGTTVKTVAKVDGPSSEDAAGLQMMSRGEVAWARSQVIEPPTTGRLSLLVWLRTTDANRQPPLRLALDAKLVDGVYYQFAPVGSLASEQQPQTITSEWRQFAVHFDDLPQQGILELRIGFDLMGDGLVQIDNVQLFDGWFDQTDQRGLLQKVSAARLQFNQGNLLAPYKMLDGYWPRLLNGLPDVEDSGTAPGAEDPGVRSARENFNVLDRMKQWVPTPRLPFR